MKTRPLLGLLLSATVLGSVMAEDPSTTPPAEAVPAKELCTQALFESHDKESLAAAIAKAREAKVSEQAILEARFVFLVDQADYAGIAALAPELEAGAEGFDPVNSAIFTIKEEFLAVIEYSRALAALEAGDQAGFKTHITEAFWLSPSQGAAFAPHIDRLRLKEAMAALKIDLQHKLIAQESGKPLSLAEACGQASLILLHFWSPWSEECVASLTDFVATSNELAKNGIAVVAVLAESNPEALAEANTFATKTGAKAACRWVLDQDATPLSRDLRVLDLPVFALIHKDGSVLFNGHPAEPELWEVLKKAAPEVTRPELAAPADGVETDHGHDH